MTVQRREAFPTMQLRFVERKKPLQQELPDGILRLVKTSLILQQLWRVPQDPSPTDLSAWREVWQDVETVGESDSAE